MFPRAAGGDQTPQGSTRVFRDKTCQFAVLTVEPAAGRIGGSLRNSGELEGFAVVDGRMSAAMAHFDRVIRRKLVKVAAVDRAAFVEFRVVVFESNDPFTRRGFGGPTAKRLLDSGDAAQVDVDVQQFGHARPGGMRMRVDEPGCHRHAFRIDDFSGSSSEGPNVVVAANGEEPGTLDRESLHSRLPTVDCVNTRVVQD